MKKLIALIGAMAVLPCFAEVAPVYFDESGAEYYFDNSGNLMDSDGNPALIDSDGNIAPLQEELKKETVVKPVKTALHSVSANRSASRAIPSATNETSKRNTVNRNISNRSISSRTPNTSRSSGRAQTSVISRKSNLNNNSVARSGSTLPTARSLSYDTTDSTGTARVGVRTSSSAIRSSVPRITSTATTEPEVIYNTVSADELAQMTDFCQAQYTACMDQYCNVLDDNQGRCSCSKNIDNYTKTEDGLKEATMELQNVAQKIQYIGLAADEVESLFTQTEAEQAMQGKTDSTQLKNDLDNIKKLIIDVKSGNASASGSGINLDLSSLLDFNFSNSGFDLGSVLGGGNVSSISNQRGKKLYDTATARCKTSVLDKCESQGVNIAIITNGYDLQIDKQCLAYEKELVDSNEEMKRTVSNAKVVLQKARLLVAQQKNEYDLKGCITALDECMQDDFVCGNDYESCLDPTGKYIENGEVVIGS